MPRKVNIYLLNFNGYCSVLSQTGICGLTPNWKLKMENGELKMAVQILRMFGLNNVIIDITLICLPFKEIRKDFFQNSQFSILNSLNNPLPYD